MVMSLWPRFFAHPVVINVMEIRGCVYNRTECNRARS